MSKFKKVCAWLCVMSMASAAGCSQSDVQSSSSSQPDTSGAQTSSQAPAESKPAESSLPAGQLSDKPITLTYWVPLGSNAAASITSFGENAMYQELEKITNVHIDFQHPTLSQEKEQFNLMIAARDLPDLIEYSWNNYPGGPEKAVMDNIIIELDELIDQYAPDAKSLMESSPVVKKQSKSDAGAYYAFMAVGESNGNTQSGPTFRADWLTELGLSDPTTLEEWTAVLRAFRDQKGAEAPYTTESATFITENALVGAFGVGPNYYQMDGKVNYGPIQPQYKEYLAFLKSWYDEGILDPDFASNDRKTMDSKMLNHKSGAFVGYAGGSMGTYLTSMKDIDPKFDLKPVAYPKMNDGRDPLFHSRAWEVRGSGSLAITSVNKYPEISAQWANFFYTEKGGAMKNFGVEGLTYNLVGGELERTELITKNPDGLSMSQALAKYSRGDSPSPGPIIKLPGAIPRVNESVDVWNKHSDNATQVLIPPITQTPAEAEELATFITNIDAYHSEMFVKFIMGQESLDNFDKFVDQLKKYGVERVVELKQQALDRYNAR